jgi:hypothetical protein
VDYARIARLGTGAHLTFFVAVLGEPAAMRITTLKEDYVEYITPGDPDFGHRTWIGAHNHVYSEMTYMGNLSSPELG